MQGLLTEESRDNHLISLIPYTQDIQRVIAGMATVIYPHTDEFTLTLDTSIFLMLLDMYHTCMATILLVLTYESTFSYLNGTCITGMLLRDIIRRSPGLDFHARLNTAQAEQYLVAKALAHYPDKYTLYTHFKKHINVLPNLRKILAENSRSYHQNSMAHNVQMKGDN